MEKLNLTVSSRNYVTKTVTKLWAKDSRNNKKPIEGLHQVTDDVVMYQVFGDDDFIEAFLIVDTINKFVYACGGRDRDAVATLERKLIKDRYVLALYGTVSKELESRLPCVADAFIENTL
jgi:hypothetical protein